MLPTNLKLKTIILSIVGFVSCSLVLYAANEIEMRAVLKYAPDSISRDTTTQKFDQNGNSYSWGRQVVETSAWEAVTISADVLTNGPALFVNATTNAGCYIDLATASNTGIFSRLYGRQMAMIPMGTETFLAKSTCDTNAVTQLILEKLVIGR